MSRSITLVALLAVLFAGAVAAQPDRPPAVEKAKAKFEKEVAKSEEALLTGLDKAIAKATTGKMKVLQEKLTYDKELFTKYHIAPTTYSADTYLRARVQQTRDLVAAYQPVINELTKAKKFAEATALDDDLNELVRSARGYGLAFPDMEFQPVFLIENKHAGLVIDTTTAKGTGDLVLTEKVGRRKPSQCWKLERDEAVWYIKNALSGQVFHVVNASRNAGTTIITAFINPKTEPDKRSVFTLSEVHREIVIESAISSMVLTATERKEKGVTVTYVTQEKKEATPSAAQLWALTEAK